MTKKVIVIVVAAVVFTLIVEGLNLLAERGARKTPSETAALIAGEFSPEVARVGETFGVWTVRENKIGPKETYDVTGAMHQGLDGSVFFDGSLSVRGRYIFNDLSGGVLLYPDKEFWPYLPQIKDDDRKGLAIALFGTLTDLTYESQGRIAVTITGLAYQKVFCAACDAWNGWYVEKPLSTVAIRE
jgi:hypothetical protein